MVRRRVRRRSVVIPSRYAAGIAPSSSFERAVEILLGRLDANGPHRLRRAEPARCRRTRARLERRIEEDARTSARATEAGSLGRKHGRAPLKHRRFIVRSASGSARGGCGLKARGSRRTPAVPRDGPASSGNHDEDIRLRRAVPVQALRVSAGARRAIHLSRVLNIVAPLPRLPSADPTRPSFYHQGVMGKVLKAADAGENALLESPTGSGKSLALLCSGT